MALTESGNRRRGQEPLDKMGNEGPTLSKELTLIFERLDALATQMSSIDSRLQALEAKTDDEDTGVIQYSSAPSEPASKPNESPSKPYSVRPRAKSNQAAVKVQEKPRKAIKVKTATLVKPSGRPSAGPAGFEDVVELGPSRALGADGVARPFPRPKPAFASDGTSGLMALGAGSAFVLAAIYFIKLVFDSGWLTPPIQIGLAISSAIGLIFAGLWMAEEDRDYAAVLPAAGVVILYLSLYAAHAYYGLIPPLFLMFGVGATTFGSIWLQRKFDNTIFAIFAVVGAYACPIFIQSKSGRVLDLALYFTVWSVLFSFFALQEGRRVIYLIAMYFAIIVFDLAWRQSAGRNEWELAVIYQLVQFALFSGTAMAFAVKHKRFWTGGEAFAHGSALFYFYCIEYFILKRNAPQLAPYVAMLSVLGVTGLFFAAKKLFQDESRLRASGVLVSVYVSAVTTHILFFELLPLELMPWAALTAPLVVLLRPRFDDREEAYTPIAFIAGLVFIIGFLTSVGAKDGVVVLPQGALFGYTAILYGASYLLSLQKNSDDQRAVFLYAGHIAFMVATLKLLGITSVLISVSWGVAAILMLVIAVQTKDKILAQSSLLIFAASGLKVMMLDLAGQEPILRVMTLVVLGVSLYAGGYLYKTIGEEEANP